GRAAADGGVGVRALSDGYVDLGPARSSPRQTQSSEEIDMSATYTFDVFSSLDGYASHKGDWGGYWGKQGPELLEHCRASVDAEQRMVFGATTFRDFVGMLAASDEEPEVLDAWVTGMRGKPATVVSSTLE